MNVEYQCPICHSRGFFEAGKPIYKCHIHTDTIMVQTEFFQGPNFSFKDEGDTDPKKTGILTVGADPGAVSVIRTKSSPQAYSEEEEFRQLKAMYERVTDKPPDGRWSMNRLRQEIEKFEHDRGVELEPHEEDQIDDAAEVNS